MSRLSTVQKHEAVGRAVSRLEPDLWERMLSIATEENIVINLMDGRAIEIIRPDCEKVVDVQMAVLKEAELPELPIWSGKKHTVTLMHGIETFSDKDMLVEMLPQELTACFREEDDEGVKCISVDARIDDRDLGCVLDGKPPGPVCLGSLRPGGWAESVKLKAGDKLVTVQGRAIENLGAGEINELWFETRPLYLVFQRKDPKPLRRATLIITADETIANVGWAPTGFPPNPVFVKSVDDGGWAAEATVVEGDELVECNDQAVNSMTAIQLKKAVKQRPLRLGFARGERRDVKENDCSQKQLAKSRQQYTEGRSLSIGTKHRTTSKQKQGELSLQLRNDTEALQKIDVFLYDGDPIGFKFRGASPSIVTVRKLEEQSNAALGGVQAGDTLLCVGGKGIAQFKNEESLNRALNKRPLKLTFERQRKSRE